MIMSAMPIQNDRPEFYIRLNAEERFGIVRLKPGKQTHVARGGFEGEVRRSVGWR